MVADSGTPARADALRPLNRPRRVEVLVRRGDNGGPEPVALIARGRRQQVERIEDAWRVEEEWWRERPIRRRYYRLRLASGAIRTVYRDGVEDAWYEQAY